MADGLRPFSVLILACHGGAYSAMAALPQWDSTYQGGQLKDKNLGFSQHSHQHPVHWTLTIFDS